MAILKVLTWPAKILETKAEEVSQFDQSLSQLAQDMHETMDQAGGIGLAANQVGVLKRVLVIYIPFNEAYSKPWHKNQGHEKFWHNQRYTFVNPKITAFKGRHSFMEGCLSFPGQMDYVDRHIEITVQYQNLKGNSQSIQCDDLMSICLQHEIDHINGTLFVERMNEKSAKTIKEQMLHAE